MKDLFYNLNDLILTIVIIAVIVFSITFIMNGSLGLDLTKEGIFDSLSNQPPQVVTTEPVAPVPPLPSPTTVEPSPSEPTVQSSEPSAEDTYVLTVSAKTTWPLLSKALEENGVIEDAKAFVLEVANQGIDTQLKPGTFTFNKGLSNEEAIKVLFP